MLSSSIHPNITWRSYKRKPTRTLICNSLCFWK